MGTYQEKWSFQNDIDNIVLQCSNIWNHLDGANIFITGGTGFVGRWILESIYTANHVLDITINVVVLTRDIDRFFLKFPYLVNYSKFRFEVGNVNNGIDVSGNFTHMIHAATDASAYLNEVNPLKMFNTVVQGSLHAFEFAQKRSIDRILYLSSGAVYGQQPWDMKYIPESWNGSLDCNNVKNTYAEAKRAGEMLCSVYAKQFGLNISIARIFGLLGPGLPLSTHFAAGNFIKDAIDGKKVVVNGNGIPYRSFLYPSDLTVWLLHILIYAKSNKSYNVGSKKSISIKNLAKHIANIIADGDYIILGKKDKGWNSGRYVPDTSYIENDLGVKETVSLDDAIYRTAIWNGWKGKNYEII